MKPELPIDIQADSINASRNRLMRSAHAALAVDWPLGDRKRRNGCQQARRQPQFLGREAAIWEISVHSIGRRAQSGGFHAAQLDLARTAAQTSGKEAKWDIPGDN